MSSIFGKCNTDKNGVAATELKWMQEALNYWNADDANIWITGHVGLGCLMLYNTLESLQEKLPIENKHLQLCITADARVDNRYELYSLLQINTPEGKQMPDSGIIMLLYKKYGADCIKHLVGDFAFAIWDEREQKLFCARDQMGIKPFFYYNDSHFFAFASEKKGILLLPGVDKSIDKDFFCNQLFRPVIQAADTTIYKKIRRLEPAHTLTFYPSKNQLETSRYWTLDPYAETKLQRKEDYYDGLRYHFEQAVKCRIRSNYTIGTELSGGLDSSAITGAASRFLKSEGKKIITFTNALDEHDRNNEDIQVADERKYAEAVIQFNDISDYEFITKDIWDDPLDEVDYAIKINDGLEMRNQLWLLPIKKAAMQKNVRTLLSGFPGDEMVTYRGGFYFLDFWEHKKYIKYFLCNETWHTKLKPLLSPDMEYFLHKIKNILRLHGLEIKQVFEFYKLPASYRFKYGDVAWNDIEYRERFKSHRHYLKYKLLKPQVGLRMESETRFGLGFKTEPRYPMADIRLTQFFLSMPNNLKTGGSINRNTYRIAVKNFLPELIFERSSKYGSVAPFMSDLKKKNSRHEHILNLIIQYEKKQIYKAKIANVFFQNKYIKPGSLEILRWFGKNFENL